ncbi:capsule biosynthesis protein [Pseudosulfitobacter sp. SM2401]|uniref:capsule biosynthesis protein n=1 Tax=Pseudosulfitobacter sp. SM2401 TaxID=3350098 RepID=UPI0036F32AEB
MTTKPKARKFRIKRSTPTASAATEETVRRAVPQASEPPAQTPPPAPQGPGRVADQLRQQTARPQPAAPQPQARTGEVSSAAQVAGETDIDAIRREGLTGRQLRMARRVAQKHNLAPTSDFDAVRLLREAGIDPFQRSNMLELVVPPAGGEHREGAPPEMLGQLTPTQAGAGRVQLPQTVPAGRETLPSTEISPAERRSREITEIQRDISRRRRKKMGLLLVRLAFFVMMPTLLAGYYFYAIATPMYATESDFLIISNEGSGGTSPFGGILPPQFSTGPDAIAVQGYLQSKDAMIRLNNDAGFKDHFTQEWIDPIQRLTPDPTNEEAFKLYKKNVKIGYDPTEGMIRMEVVAADPNVATDYARNLISYASERINNISQGQRDDGMRDAIIAFDKAKQDRLEAQEKLIRLKNENGADPEAVIAAYRAQITNYETSLIEKELELAALLDNSRPNQAKVDGARGDIRRLNATLLTLNNRLNLPGADGLSLAQQAVAQQLAQADLANADANLQLANGSMEQARTEANRQVRYLNVAVEPVASEEPSYPRSFENTILAFLIFAGIYLMISLTASILREQVTS